MYISPLFRKMLTYAKSLQPRAIFILSAQHGLVRLDETIAPYEKTLTAMGKAERKTWSEGVLCQLHRAACLEKDHFIILAGEAYREHLSPHLHHYEVPMQGLGLGCQLQWLNKACQGQNPS